MCNASMLFWTFGTLQGKLGELGLITARVVSMIYFHIQPLKYNAIDAGDETANGLA